MGVANSRVCASITGPSKEEHETLRAQLEQTRQLERQLTKTKIDLSAQLELLEAKEQRQREEQQQELERVQKQHQELLKEKEALAQKLQELEANLGDAEKLKVNLEERVQQDTETVAAKEFDLEQKKILLRRARVKARTLKAQRLALTTQIEAEGGAAGEQVHSSAADLLVEHEAQERQLREQTDKLRKAHRRARKILQYHQKDLQTKTDLLKRARTRAKQLRALRDATQDRQEGTEIHGEVLPEEAASFDQHVGEAEPSIEPPPLPEEIAAALAAPQDDEKFTTDAELSQYSHPDRESEFEADGRDDASEPDLPSLPDVPVDMTRRVSTFHSKPPIDYAGSSESDSEDEDNDEQGGEETASDNEEAGAAPGDHSRSRSQSRVLVLGPVGQTDTESAAGDAAEVTDSEAEQPLSSRVQRHALPVAGEANRWRREGGGETSNSDVLDRKHDEPGDSTTYTGARDGEVTDTEPGRNETTDGKQLLLEPGTLGDTRARGISQSSDLDGSHVHGQGSRSATLPRLAAPDLQRRVSDRMEKGKMLRQQYQIHGQIVLGGDKVTPGGPDTPGNPDVEAAFMPQITKQSTEASLPPPEEAGEVIDA